jgi:predicted dehydrogenase
MTDRPLRVGFVGAGTIAEDRHVPGLRALPGVELTAVVTRTPESSMAAARRFGFARTAATPQALIEDPGIDAVVVATWPSLHAPLTVAALDAGKHVLSQARMAMNAAEARAMADAARRHPELTTMLVPASHTFWVDATLARLLADGTIGTLRTLSGTWNEPDVIDPGEHWRHQRRFSGNNAQGVAPLYEVLLRWLGPAVGVTARSDLYEPHKPGPDGQPIVADLPDHVSFLADFPAGVAAAIDVASHSGARGPSVLTFTGSSGVLRLDMRGNTLELADGQGAWRAVDAGPGRDWDVEGEFVRGIRGGPAPTTNDFAIGVEYMTFMDAVMESAETGRRIVLRRGA